MSLFAGFWVPQWPGGAGDSICWFLGGLVVQVSSFAGFWVPRWPGGAGEFVCRFWGTSVAWWCR